MEESELFFDFYGILASAVSRKKALLEGLERDFSFFKRENASRESADITVQIKQEKPPFDSLPYANAIAFKRRCIVYASNTGERFIDYHGKALVKENSAFNNFQVFSLDSELLHELAYSIIQTRAGELLDKKGFHRLHGFAFSTNGKAIVCLSQIGTGKTSMALELLMKTDFKLLSEDSPVVSGGKLFPFPIRFGIRNEPILEKIPKQFKREFHSLESGNKTLVDTAFFGEKISKDAAEPWILLIGKKAWTGNPGIKKISSIYCISKMLRNSVFGFGLAQAMEYFLKNTVSDFLGKSLIGSSRFFSTARLALKSKCFEFTFGNNATENAKAIIELVQRESAKKG